MSTEHPANEEENTNETHIEHEVIDRVFLGRIELNVVLLILDSSEPWHGSEQA